MAIHLFAANAKKATLTPGKQAAISAGEIIVVGGLIDGSVAATQYLSGAAIIDYPRLEWIAVLAFLFAMLKASATYLSNKAAPQLTATNPELAPKVEELGQKLLNLTEVIQGKTLTPLQAGIVTTATTVTPEAVKPDITRGNTIAVVPSEIVTPPLPPAA